MENVVTDRNSTNPTSPRVRRAFLLGTAVALVLGGAVASEAILPNGPAIAQPVTVNPVQAPGFADMVEKVSPAVVGIRSRGDAVEQSAMEMPNFGPGNGPMDRFFREFRGQPDQQMRPRQQMSMGSGFFVTEDGYVVTNNHVVDHATEFTVIMNDGAEYPATLVGKDNKTDLALLKVDADRKFAYVQFAKDDVRVGDWVIAVGTPFGLGGTVTAGIVSGRGRQIGEGPYDDFLQIDAAVNRGNSGGPTFNLNGEVVGVNTAIFSPSGTNAGLAFSIPSNLVKQVADQLREFGKVKRGWIGVSYQSVTDDIADSFGLDRARGVLVANVTADGPASKAGLKRNDIILSFAGQDVLDLRRFPKIVANTRVGNTVDVVVWRGGKEVPLKLRVGEQEEAEKQNTSAQGSKKPSPPDQPVTSTIEQLGLTLQKVTDQLRERYGLSDQVKGVIVTKVAPNSPAAEKQLQPGDVILEVDQKPVTTPQEVSDLVTKLQQQKKRSVLLFVERQGDPRFAALRLQK